MSGVAEGVVGTVDAPDGAKILDPKAFEGKILGVQASTVQHQYVTKYYPEIEVKAYDTADNSMADLAAGRIDFVLSPDLYLHTILATPQGAAIKWQPVRIAPEQVARLEAEVAALNADLPPLTSFVLPGGTALAAHLHVARAVARRAERSAVALAAAEPDGLSADVVRYLNRLSDLLFVAARYANRRLGDGDVLWKPGATR